MERKQRPPNLDDWEKLPFFIQFLIAGKICYHAILPRVLNFLYRVDLWLFPPLVFYSAFKSSTYLIPAAHTMALMAVLSISFMATTLSLFLLRPPKRLHAHWVLPPSPFGRG